MNEPFIRYPTANQVGFIPAYEGDGVVTERLHVARGTVQPQTSPTICTQRDGGCGVVIDNKKTTWFNGSKKDGVEECNVGDGLKIYPDPARYNSGGTVQKEMTNAMNTYRGCGSGTLTKDLRIRYLTPRECLRLMGFDDESIDRLIEAVPSKTNQYKLAGNSIVVDCLESIFKAIYIDRNFRHPRPKQISLLDFEEKKVNPILMRSAEEIEREVTELEGKQ